MSAKPDFYPALTVGGLTNARRAEFALNTMRFYEKEVKSPNEPLETLIDDLLNDLLHLLDATGEEDSLQRLHDCLNSAADSWLGERDLRSHEGEEPPEQATQPIEF